MANDSGLFRTAARKHELREPVPLYEAKMIHQFDHRWATYTGDADDAARDVTDAEKADADFAATPRYWVEREEVEQRLADKGWTRQWLMGWRDIARSTDERTVIATVFPRLACGDTLLLMFPSNGTVLQKLCLMADQCSLVHDYVARQKIGGTHLKYHYKKQIPNLAPGAYTSEALGFIEPRITELVCVAADMKPLALDAKDAPAVTKWDAPRRAYLRAELDAYFAALYGLNRDELRYILDPADAMGSDYPSETFRVLKEKEIRQFGEYRTRRLVLEAWDRLEKSGELPDPVEPHR
jgi:hypothetical protein